MKIQIRQGVFETNSSSCHSLTVCDIEDYELWEDGIYLFNENKQEFVNIRGLSKEEISNLKKKRRLLTCNEYIDKYIKNFHYEERFRNGKTEICFGHTGYDDF